MILKRVKFHVNERLDLDDINSLEGYCRADSNYWHKQMFSAENYIVKGFAVTGIGAAYATVDTTNGTILHGENTGDYSYYISPVATTTMTIPASSLTASSRNYVEFELSEVAGTPASRVLWDKTANSGDGAEFTQTVNTATSLSLGTQVNTTAFSGDADLIPLCYIDVNAGGLITAITDQRNLFFRTTNPSIASFAISTDDSEIKNFKNWMDAITNEIKAMKASTNWYDTFSPAGVVNSGTAGRLAIYAGAGKIVDDTYEQNSNDISVQIAAHSTLSADRLYTIPDSGADANFVMSEGNQAINGNKTLIKNLTVAQSVITPVANAADIDWSLANLLYVQIDDVDDTTFTFSNYTSKIIRLVVDNTGTHKPIWPSGILWDGGSTAPVQNNNAQDMYEFTSINGAIFGLRVAANINGTWPYGIEGNLHITTGVTYDIVGGSIHDWNDLTIDTGGKLRITGNTTDFTKIGVKGVFTFQGTIECKDSTATGATSTVTPSGIAISNTIAQKLNGAGGASSALSLSSASLSAISGGAATSSVGGTGAGGSAIAGDAYSVSYAYGSSNGTGAYIEGLYYFVGHYKFCSATGGTGGTGGAKGLHGKNLFLQVTGHFHGTGGVIDVRGSAGSNGTAGSNGSVYLSGVSSGGGGGGGGCGGTAGKIYVRHGATYDAPTYLTTGGAAGTGGTKGTGAVVGAGSIGTNYNGSAGQAGDDGSTDIA